MIARNKSIVGLLVLSFFLLQSMPTIGAPPKKARAKANTPKKGAGKKSANNKANTKKKPPEKKEFKRDSKAEAQEWEKRKKDMKPLQLRDLIEENHKLRMQMKAFSEGTTLEEIIHERELVQEQLITHEQNLTNQATQGGSPVQGHTPTTGAGPTEQASAYGNTTGAGGAIQAAAVAGALGAGIGAAMQAGGKQQAAPRRRADGTLEPAGTGAGTTGAANAYGNRRRPDGTLEPGGTGAGTTGAANAYGNRRRPDGTLEPGGTSNTQADYAQQQAAAQQGRRGDSRQASDLQTTGGTYPDNLMGSAALAAGAAGNLALRDLAELPAGSYTIDQENGKVFIGGIVDERYGVDLATGIPFIKGVLFKVQIGARDDVDLRNILIDEVNHQNLEQEEANNLHKYTIGHFRDYWEADRLKKGLRIMGIELAWIVPYQDGKRVALKEVLDIVLEQRKQRDQHPTHPEVATSSEMQSTTFSPE